ncbi:OmpA family protein [Dyadobacter sp. SG02]|uniref:OmpA family protein n=1 Tax=Dyadobacter sp. SG02 TaxID=1855291 RepID=UPI0008D6288B|nr:OmpA family protein [Dyadobacter sp. SG02]SEJ57708.1 OmpA family protein [Dyadobacter sp. SG02]
MKTFTTILFLAIAAGFAAYGQQQVAPNQQKIIPQRSRVAVRVLDKYTLRPVEATIMVVGQRPEDLVVPLFEDGAYQFKMSARDMGVISIHAHGYETHSEVIAARTLRPTKVFYLTPIGNSDSSKLAAAKVSELDLKEEVETVLLFTQSEPDLLPESNYELEILADYLVRNTAPKIELYGHTDDVGDPRKNLLLSFDRVDEVKKYLISRRIEMGRIRGKAFGSGLPVAPNDCEANRRLNRRVEIRIVP